MCFIFQAALSAGRMIGGAPMLFNSVQYLIFLPVVLLVYYLIPDRGKTLWLLLCSYFFYMCWNAMYLLLILASTLATWLCALALERIDRDSPTELRTRRKKLAVGINLFFNLGILFFFKYFQFTLDNLEALLALAHVRLSRPGFDILLPVGISFYTFQAIGYTIDVYRGDMKAERNLLRYALFVSFFPQLVAGPIERSGNLLSQLSVPHRFRFENLLEGLYLILWGFFLKIVLADRIAPFVDLIYGPNYADYGGFSVVLATFLFVQQIYCDFAGYSVIAMGSAKMLGIDLMENFNTPFLSLTVAEFWQRWHVSLSSWFRDYLYIPLGGGRRGKARKALNTLITFFVSGLWHGASWGFVVWGLLNGVFQIVGAALKPLRKKLSRALCLDTDSMGFHLWQMFFTFSCFSFSLVFFRARDVRVAVSMLRSVRYFKIEALFGDLFYGTLDGPNTVVLGLGLLLLLFADCMKYRGVKLRSVLMRQDYLFQAVFLSVSIAAILLFGIWGSSYSAASFIYFQF